MATKRFPGLFWTRLALFSLACVAGPGAHAGVAVTVTPTAVSNTFNGTIALQVTGVAAGDTVVVQKFLDLNGNGVIDAPDLLVQQFSLTDGEAGMAIGGITNINVPGDTDATSGQITAKLALNNNDFVQLVIGKYLFKVSSPSGSFAALTNGFAVTNFPFPQGIIGTVVSNGTSTALANAVTLLFPPPRPGHHDLGQPLAGAVANASGNYSIQTLAGEYRVFAFKSNYVMDASSLQSVHLIGGTAFHTNVSLLPATASISGQLVNATNSNKRLPGALMTANNDSGLVAIGGSDTNGNYVVNVQSGAWNLGALNGALLLHGYVDPNNNVSTNAGATGVDIPFTKASALVYGQVSKTNGTPAPGIDVNTSDNNGSLYNVDVFTDQNGNYVMGVAGGLGSSDPWSVYGSSGSNPTNDLFSQPAFDQNGGTNIAPGEAVRADFTLLTANYLITGAVQAGGTNIVGVGVNASATIGGKTYISTTDTDANGQYTLNVANGNWTVGLSCNGGNDSLDGILGAGNYVCPNGTNLNISSNNGTANITVQFQTYDAYVSGRVVDSAGNPVGDMNLFVFSTEGQTTFGGVTDGDGNYRFGVDAGSYVMQLNTDPNTGAPARGLVGPSIPLTVTSAVNISNLIVVAQLFTGAINASITNSSNNSGVAGVDVNAFASVNGTNYSISSIPTDSFGRVSLGVCNGFWHVSADCLGLLTHGFGCPNGVVAIDIVNDSEAANFLVSPLAVSQPSLGQASWSPGRFQMALTGVPNQNYTVQSSTTLTNWSLLFVTNSGTAGTLILTDSTATNRQTFYRILVGP